MPRDGSGVYTQPFPDVAPDTTIESAVYNGFVADVVQDLNTPRPIVAGGTGSNNAQQAMANLGGELAAYAVTNFDSHVWYPGSFRAAASATGSPVAGHAFAGNVVINEALAYPPTNQNVVVMAIDLDDTASPPAQYMRIKKAGVWGPWASVGATAATGGANGIIFSASDLFFGTRVAVVGPPAKPNRFVWNDKADATGTDIATLPEGGVPLVPTDLTTKSYVDATIASAITSGLLAAAPIDAMAFNGMQINGAFAFDQDNGSGRSTSGYFNDMWYCSNVGTAVVQHYGTSGANFPGLPTYGVAVVNGAQVSLAAADGYYWLHAIEGLRTARLAWGTPSAVPITIGFYCQHQRPGLYSISVRNRAVNRYYIATYTQNVANAVEYKSITIPGDTTGVWPTDNNTSIYLAFIQAMGATNTAAAANVWGNGNFLAAPGQVNAVGSTADRFVISGMTVLPGTLAPTAAQAMLLTRPNAEELRHCQRYFFRQFVFIQGESVSTGVGASTPVSFFPWPNVMRVTPSIASPGWGLAGVSAPTVTTPTVYSVGYQALANVAAGGRTVFVANSGTLTGDARI